MLFSVRLCYVKFGAVRFRGSVLFCSILFFSILVSPVLVCYGLFY